MPISLDPNATISFALENDQHRPPESRPEFQARFPTIRERAKLSKIIAAAADERDDDKCSAQLDEVIAGVLVGWRNMVSRDGTPVDFDLAKIDELLTHVEKWEIAYTLLGLTRLSASEKKACASLVTSGTASSANAAPPASA